MARARRAKRRTAKQKIASIKNLEKARQKASKLGKKLQKARAGGKGFKKEQRRYVASRKGMGKLIMRGYR